MLKASDALAWSPALVVYVWFLSGQWASAGREPGAWLVFVGMLAAASLAPLPHSRPSRSTVILYLQRWCWVALGGLVVLT